MSACATIFCMRHLIAILVALPLFCQPSANILLKPGHEANQPVDDEYTKKIREYTTEPFFNSPLTDYLPASKTVPTPKAVLGDIAGAPGILPYSQDVYRYMRMLEKASPRVKVFSIGKTEEGREMIAVAVASERLISSLDENRDTVGKACRSSYYQARRCRGGKADRCLNAHLLHHRDHTFARDWCADRADGVGLPAGCRRKRVYPLYSRKRDYVDYSHRGSGRARSNGGHLSLASGQSWQGVATAGVLGTLCGARQQSRCDGPYVAAHAKCFAHVCRLEGAGAARSA